MMKSHFLSDAVFPVTLTLPTESNLRFYFEPNKVVLAIVMARVPKYNFTINRSVSQFYQKSLDRAAFWQPVSGPLLTLRLINWLFLSSKTWRFWNVSISIVSKLCNLLWLRLRHLSFGWSNPSNVFILLYDKSTNFYQWSFWIQNCKNHSGICFYIKHDFWRKILWKWPRSWRYFILGSVNCSTLFLSSVRVSIWSIPPKGWISLIWLDDK